MQYNITRSAGDATVTIELADGESVISTRGAVAAKTPSVSASTGTGQGGLTGAIKSAALSDDNPLQNVLTADGDGEVQLTAQVPADILAYELSDETVLVHTPSYLGGSPDLDVDLEAASKRSFLSKEGLFFTEISGTGTIFLAGFGGIQQRTLESGETYGIEGGHLLLIEDSVEYEMNSMGDVKASVMGGEDRVADLTGPGEVWMQTSSHNALLEWIESEVSSEEGGVGSLLGN